MNVVFATGEAFTSAFSSLTSSSLTSAFSSPPALCTLSSTPGVSGTNESQVFVNVDPNTCPIVNASSGKLNNPESTKSSNNAGSSKFDAVNVTPASALQHNTLCH